MKNKGTEISENKDTKGTKISHVWVCAIKTWEDLKFKVSITLRNWRKVIKKIEKYADEQFWAIDLLTKTNSCQLLLILGS